MALEYQVVSEPVYENGVWKGAKVNMAEGYFKLGARIFNQFKQNPDFVGQIDGHTGEEDTFQSMGDRSIRCALWLAELGVRPGDVVGLCSRNQLHCCIPLFASLFLGSVCSPFSHKYLDDEIGRHYLETQGPKALFIDEENADLMTEIVRNNGYSVPIVVFGRKAGLLSFADILKIHTEEEVDKFRCKEVKPDDPALILKTSGTTSLPKGVLHSYRSFASMLKYFDSDASPSIVLGFSVVNSISGARMLIRSVIFNATTILANNLNGVEILEHIEKYKVTRVWMVPYTAHRIMKTPDLEKYDLSSVELVTLGGSRAENETIVFIEKLFKNAELYPHYGGTEFGTATLKKIVYPKLTSVGKVMPNVEMKVVDLDTKRILGPNEEGEICIRSPKLMTCYWKNQKATAEANDSEGWYATGDLGYYDTEGDFFIAGRMNEFITNLYYSCRILSSVIVDVIKKVPGVDEVGVIPQPHPDYYEIPMAFITTAPGMHVTEDDVNSAVEMKLPSYIKLRGGICFLEEIPRTETGKIKTRKLHAIAKVILEENLNKK